MSYLRGDRSVFPGQEDDFTEAFDLSLEDQARADRLYELKTKKGALSNSEQQELLDIQARLRENIITSDDWNKFGDAVYNLQDFFNNNVKGYIAERQKEWDSYTKQFAYRGRWKEGEKYKFQNMVTLPNGDLFIAQSDHTATIANQPLERKSTAVWGLIGAKGDKGDPGLSGNYRGGWSSAVSYKLGDVVTHVNLGEQGGLLYISNTNNTNSVPSSNPEDWTLMTKLWTSTNEPMGAQPGTHFIHILD